ncbi:hypothetical protein [Peribacillus glennii]|uniref:hypothetical protein n=1 Tax=Peribacillus glennii TaxID=2303991 RepID=UPI001F3F2DDA|nr:hypothetical protein [Peribacillus glennii]
MARKNRNLANFGHIANVNVNESVNETPKTTIKAGESGDYLYNLVKGNLKKKENETILTGIYLQKEVVKILDQLAKNGGRGVKSR